MNSSPVVSCAISPDADDLFMFWAITEGLIDTEGLQLDVRTADTDALNRLASGTGADVNAISVAWYPKIAAHFAMLNHGGSVGRGYGPVLVAPQGSGIRADNLAGRRIGVPGLTTTACLVMQQVADFIPVVLPISPHERVFEALERGEVEAAVLIHEGRLTWQARGLALVLDLGVWWKENTGLPLPLGGNVVRRSLGADRIAVLDRVIHRSIAYGLAHRDNAIAWLLARGGALTTYAQVDTYLGMYANQDTLDYGKDGREAINKLVRLAGYAGGPIDFVGQTG